MPPAHATPAWPQTIWRGVRGICPACGTAPIFDGYLKVHPACANCGAPFGELPADDAPPWVAMVVVLQILGVFLCFAYRASFHPGIPLAILLLALLAFICCLALRLAKGGVIAVLLKLGMKYEL